MKRNLSDFSKKNTSKLKEQLMRSSLRVMLDIGGRDLIAQHFAYRGSSNQRKGAANHIIDMVWLLSLVYPSGEVGGTVL